MVPHLDATTTAALEKNGTKGWIKGPCLWEQDQRIPVGTVNGKSRRPVRVEPMPIAAVLEPTTDAITVQQVLALPLPITTQAVQHQPTESTPAPSMTHSGSNASTFVNMPTPPDPTPDIHTATTASTPPNDPRTKVILDFEAPIVANDTVLHTSDAKPPIERYFTAVEDLQTMERTQTHHNAVPA